jgi:hypothetical protein
MGKYVIAFVVLGLLAGTAGGKNLAKDLTSKDAETRARAARELLVKAATEGLTDDEIESLAAAVDDASYDVQEPAIKALAANSKITAAQEYAAYFASRGDNFVAFLLWYSVYKTYSRIQERYGAEASGDMSDEMAEAKKEANRAFANTLDPERKSWAEPYYEALTK